jgi:hypothetical protein
MGGSVSARTQHVCPDASASSRTHVRVRADAFFTASAVNADAGGCPDDVRTNRTSGRTFSSKNVRYDIPG